MSVTSDLARLSLTIDRANELLLTDQIKMVDVGGGVNRPSNAMVMANLSTLLGGAMPYTSVELGLAGTIDGTNFSVLSEETDEYVVVYRNQNGEPLEVDRYPNNQAVKNISSIIKQFSAETVDPEFLVVTDPEGAKLASVTNRALYTLLLQIASTPGPTVIGDGEGAVDFYSDADRTIVGPLQVQHTQQPGVFFTDAEGAQLLESSSSEVAPVSPFVDGLMFAPVIATSDVREAKLYVQNILSHRELEDAVVGSFASTSAPYVSTGRALLVSASKMGATATLTLRSKADPSSRRITSVAMKHVPVQNPAINKTILFIGDSIGNRQGVQFLKQYLAELGINATFIGTLETSNNPALANDTSGPLAESREGWETGDFTYAVTDRVSAVPLGGEADYLALSKADRWPKNPFLRASTGSDAADIICNGYVFDPAFYQARFGLSTPDIVLNMLGTNNVRDRTEAAIYDSVMLDDTLMHKQIRSAWPAAKIIRSFPGTALTAGRNMVWTSHYRHLVLAMKQSAAALNYSGLTVAPVWAMTDPENGYSFAAGTPGADGFLDESWSDDVHPIGAARHSLAVALAPFVAAAALNLI